MEEINDSPLKLPSLSMQDEYKDITRFLGLAEIEDYLSCGSAFWQEHQDASQHQQATRHLNGGIM